MASKHTAELSDGRKIEVAVTNLGWCEPGAYATQFEFDGVKRTSWFACDYHKPMQCPAPQVREALDLEYLEDALRIRFGAHMVDLSA